VTPRYRQRGVLVRSFSNMKLGILSRGQSLYSTRRLAEAAQIRGHDVRVVDYLRCYLDIAPGNPRVLFRGEELTFDVVISRIAANRTFYGTAVVRQFEMMGILTVNESQSINRSRDKLRTIQILSRSSIDIPKTVLAEETRDIDGLISIVGEAPVVVKLTEGTQGVGVVLAESRSAARSLIDAFRQLDANILVQEYIKEASGTDIRCLVVGDRVVAGMERRSHDGDFRSNLHQGGSGTPVDLTDEERDIAVRATKALGLEVAGVDMLRSNRGPLVLEVNSSPGIEGIERTSNVDVAGAIIEHLEERLGEE